MGSGARHHSARQQAGLLRGRHHRADRAADDPGAGREGANAIWRRRRPTPDSSRTLTRQLSYSKGEEIVALLKGANILSNRGQAFVDTRTNTLIITDLQERLTSAVDADQHARQAAAAGRNRSAHRADESRLRARARRPVGLQRQRVAAAREHDESRVSQQRVTRRASRRIDAGAEHGSGTTTSTAVNLGVAAASSADRSCSWDRSTARSISTSRCLRSRPRATAGCSRRRKVSTLNNVAAEMTQGMQIPDSDPGQQYRHDDLQGRRAHAEGDAADHGCQHGHHADCPGERVARLRQRSAGYSANQHAARRPLLSLSCDGQTTVIGGIYTSTSATTRDTTPGLSNIPLLGWLFRRDTSTTRTRNC